MEGNQQKMREALSKLREEIGLFYNNEWIPYDAWQGCDDMISHALSAPARQCDVGTEEEQEVRFEHFCYLHKTVELCCEHCPLLKARCSCELAWAQMPYEAQEGENNG